MQCIIYDEYVACVMWWLRKDVTSWEESSLNIASVTKHTKRASGKAVFALLKPGNIRVGLLTYFTRLSLGYGADVCENLEILHSWMGLLVLSPAQFQWLLCHPWAFGLLSEELSLHIQWQCILYNQTKDMACVSIPDQLLLETER